MNKVFHFDAPREKYHCDAAIIWCFDNRFELGFRKFLKRIGVSNSDPIKIAGGAMCLASPELETEREFVLGQGRKTTPHIGESPEASGVFHEVSRAERPSQQTANFRQTAPEIHVSPGRGLSDSGKRIHAAGRILVAPEGVKLLGPAHGAQIRRVDSPVSYTHLTLPTILRV